MEASITFDRRKAEVANTWTHAASLAAFCVMAVFLLIRGAEKHLFVLNFSLATFIVSEIFMFSSSTLYHLVRTEKLKKLFRYIDHSAIYVSIAGSYTPILLYTIGKSLGTVCFVVIWSICIIGIFYKIFALGKHPKISLAMYLVMGWLVVFIAKPVFEHFPVVSLWFLLGEGMAFSVGTIFFWKDNKHTYFHAIWHLFIFGGCVCHYLVLWFLI